MTQDVSLVRQPLLATSIALALAGCSIAHAGTVDVKYVQDGQYTDAGRGRDLEQVEWSLTQHLQQLGAKSLPARQTLSIEVLDIDLAGELRPWHRVWPDARVMRGSTDWPRIKLHFSPGEKGSGFVFDARIVGGSVPKEYIPGVQKGLEASVLNGVIAGFPMTDLKIELTDGAYHEVDSSVMAFEIAARSAFREGAAKASPQLLEPVMRVEAVTPDEYMGDIIGDLNSRRGQITGMEPRGNAQVVSAMVPLATMFGYVNTLRSLSQGRAQFTMHFDHYEPVPAVVAEEIRAKYA